MAGGPATSARGRAGKFNKPSRGGGKKFSRSLQPVDADGNQISMWAAEAAGDRSEEEEEDSEAEESEEDSDADSTAKAPLSAENREDRKALKKARKEAAIAKQSSRTVEVGDLPSSDDESDSGMPANPNHSKAARKQANKDIDDLADGVKNMTAPGNRKDREALEAAAAKDRDLKLQAEGKTDQAQADLARLKLIREQRAADAARRHAEKEEKEELEKARKTEIEAREAKKREAAAGQKKGKKK